MLQKITSELALLKEQQKDKGESRASPLAVLLVTIIVQSAGKTNGEDFPRSCKCGSLGLTESNLGYGHPQMGIWVHSRP